MRKLLLFFMIIPLVAVLVRQSDEPVQAAIQGLPPGFASRQVATGLNLPTDMVILPDGRFLITEKGSGDETNGSASVRLVDSGGAVSIPVVTLPVNASYDSGLLAIVLDPDFETNNYFYLWYATAQGSKNWIGESKLRLSRLTFSPASGTASPASEQIILDNIAWGSLHHGNSLLFQDDGTLLIGLGDRVAPQQAQDFTDWERGKIIRIRPLPNGGYEIPADNPFLGVPAIPDIIYSFGVRNPYRIVQRQSDGVIVFGDVGESAWEEINLMQPSKNYGWAVREGPCERGQLTGCSPAGSGYTDPIIAYQHDPNRPPNASGAITGLAFYEGGNFPAPYQNKIFWSDFNENHIAFADLNTPSQIQIFTDNAPFITDIEYSRQSLFTLHIGSGTIQEIYYQGGTNQIPTAVISATPLSAAPNTTITFSAAGTTDPDDTNLTYYWDFGDGQSAVTTTPSTTHTYQSDATYTAALEVHDPRGGRSAEVTAAVTIYSGEFPTIDLTISTNPGRSIFHGGDVIEYDAQRSNHDGLDPTLPYRWHIDMHHNDHVHPIRSNQATSSGTFSVPTENHDNDWNIWYRFRLIMRTESGQDIMVSRQIFPNVVNLTIDQSPGSSSVVVNQSSRSMPFTFKAIAGVNQTLTPPDRLIYNREVYGFSQWRWYITSPDIAATGTTFKEASPFQFNAPVEDTTYVADYTYQEPARLGFLPHISR